MNTLKFTLFLMLLAVWSCKSEPKTTSANQVETSDLPTDSVSNTTTLEQSTGKGVNLSGKLVDFRNQPIIISKIGYNQAQPTLLTQGTIDAEGLFSLDFNPQKKGVFILKVGNQQVLFLLKGDETKIMLESNLANFRAYNFEFKGAPINDDYLELMKAATEKSYTLDQMKREVLLAKEPLVASLVALQVLKDPGFLNIHQSVYKKLLADKQVDKDLYVKGYQNILSSMEKYAAQQNQSNESNIKVGMQAPELAFKDPKGKIRKLSDLKGKLVLLDFWASWCGPCRRANPEVVQIYNKYKDQGFTVFSVSLDGSKKDSSPAALDRARAKWVAAIKKDGLAWAHHVSDLKSWNSAASAKYGVTSIPATFLIDRTGKIVELNPGRRGLAKLIEKHL